MLNLSNIVAAATSDDLASLIEAHDFAMQTGYQAHSAQANMPAEFASVVMLAQAFRSGLQLAELGIPLNTDTAATASV